MGDAPVLSRNLAGKSRNASRRRLLSHRGRSAVVSALCAFLAIELLISLAVDYIVPGIREPEYGRKLTFLQAQLRQSPQRPLLLLLGSSRTAYGIRPDALFPQTSQTDGESPICYNFGILGGGPIYEMLYFRRVLQAGIHPRWVVVEVHPGLLKVVPELLAAHQPAIERCDARDLCALGGYLDDPWTAWRGWLLYRAAGCHHLRAELMRNLAPTWVPASTVPNLTGLDQTTPFGWVPLAWPRPDEAVRKQRAAWGCQAFGPSYSDFEVSDRTNRALHEILAICRREEIGAALLLMPEAEEMRDERARLAQSQILDYLARLGKDYGAPVIDATRWCAEDEFADGQHLLPEGAERLSTRLGSESLGHWIASTSPRRDGDPSGTIIAGRRGRELRR